MAENPPYPYPPNDPQPAIEAPAKPLTLAELEADMRQLSNAFEWLCYEHLKIPRTTDLFIKKPKQ
jgi:hypothetical protein